MSNSDTFIEQDIFNYSDRLAIRSFTSQDLSRASQAIIDSGSNVLGLSIEYADTLSNRRRTKGKERGKAKGVVRALAIATTDKVYYISFDDSKAMQTGKETAFSDVLCGHHVSLAAFSMARLILHINRDLRYHAKGFDLSTIYTSPGEPWSAASFLHEKVKSNIDQFRVNSLWHRDHDDMASACLRAWISAKCAASLNEYVWIARQVDTTNLYKGQLALLGRLVLTAHQLESLKPLKVDNEFRAVTPGKPGKLVVECLRYKTRVRKSKQTRVILEDSHGGRVVCQAVTAVGKRTTVVPSKGRYQDGIQRVSVEGREEMTCAEKACDAFILRVLRKEINLHDRPLINTLWFPPPTLAKTPRPKHISPVSPAFCRLNTSQRQVAAAMISTTESVVIAHGPPGTGKTTTIAAAVDYWQQESKPVWIVAQSNVGVKNIARSLVGKSFHGFKLIVSKEFHFEWHEELYARVEHNLIRSDELARTPNPIETERKLAGSRIILCTLSMLSNPFLDDARVYSFVPVERLVVDEASQINVSEYMHLIHKFKKLQKLCFFGDPKQLPPFGQEAAPAMQSIFEVKHLKPRAYFLDTQYRMPIPLGNFISDEVYNKKLKSVHKISDISCVSFVDVDKGTEESCGKSWTNSSEVQVIVTLVRRYYRRKPFAIITPYDPQRAAIQAALEKENLPSDCVYTVDSFQGHEQDFIIVSTVRTSAPGFLSSLHRNNVMLSRPTTGMVIVTNKHFLMSSGRDTLVGRLAKRWEVLANGKDCVWINWRQVADETAHLPGVHAPKQPESIVAAQTPATNVIPSSLQFGNFDDLYEPYNDLRGLRITEATSSLPLCKAPQHSGKHDPKVKTKGRRVGWYHS